MDNPPPKLPILLVITKFKSLYPQTNPWVLAGKKKKFNKYKNKKKIVVQRAVSLHVTRATLEETTALAERS